MSRKVNLSILVAAVAALLAFGCGDGGSESPKVDGGSKPDEKAEIVAMMESQVDAMNREDLDGYLSTIDPDSPAYAPTKTAMEQLFTSFDVKTTLHSAVVESHSGDDAKLRTVISTEKLKGGSFVNNKITAVHTLKRKSGKWLLTASELEKVEKIN